MRFILDLSIYKNKVIGIKKLKKGAVGLRKEVHNL